jgi:3'-phosphoadenosine 5'-phosphosulfate sulfotransferase (PAPS reductase)/FAD synthetase
MTTVLTQRRAARVDRAAPSTSSPLRGPQKPQAQPLPLQEYDRILVAFSGGKDSLACVLHLLEAGVDPARIELHHHDVDGGGEQFMDWACTPAYCRAVADALGLRLLFSYRDGGFRREMDRKDTPTAPIRFETATGWSEAGGQGRNGTRGYFPQVSPDLSVRWCSAYLKIDVLDAVIRNQDRFRFGRSLVVTGERAEESPNRARYAPFERHRTDTRESAGRARYVDHSRPIHGWSERQVWEIIQRHGIAPHVAYELGWSRLSCMSCIFGSPDQWATIRAVFPEVFAPIAAREARSGKTIQRKHSVRELAERGTPYRAALASLELVAQAKAHVWTLPVRVRPEHWTLPAGAFGEAAGPT